MTGLALDAGLSATLQLVTDTITASLGFDVAVLNLIDGAELVVVAVSGREEARRKLLGARQPVADWQRLLEASEPWGQLRFLDHRTIDYSQHPDYFMWVPDIPVSADPEAWHPDDALFALLTASTGQPLGMLSVDLPRSGRRPGPEQRQALEAFGVTASLAVEHASLAAEARRGRRRFEAVFGSSPVPVALIGSDQRYLNVNDAFCVFLQRAAHELVGRPPEEFTHQEDVPATVALFEGVRSWLARGMPAEHPPRRIQEKRYLLPTGRTVWGRVHLAPLNDEADPGILIAQVEDITARKRAEERLRRQANRDALTGLANRAETLRRLRRSLLEDARAGLRTAVLFCDVDKFKWLNDTHGHAVGDAFLRAIARRLRGAVRSVDTVGRLGGDEFVLVLSGLHSEQDAVQVAERVLRAVGQPWQSGSYTFTPVLSMGVTCQPAGTASADELLAQADTAMYQAKLQQHGSWQLYSPGPVQTAVPPLQLRRDLAAAFTGSQFVLYYQPIVRLPERRVIGQEALLRWQHPTLGLLRPAQFLDVVLGSDYEAPVTDWVIRHACQQAAEHGPDSIVSVNIGASQIARSDLRAVVADALRCSGVRPDRFLLELTEDPLLSRPEGSERLSELRALGIGLALDDFGTGYAGLQYLHRFPALTALKLDRCFIARLGANPTTERIIRSAISLAAECDLMLVVEGVETDEQADRLAALGAPYAQGYRFGRPEPVPVTAAQPRLRAC